MRKKTLLALAMGINLALTFSVGGAYQNPEPKKANPPSGGQTAAQSSDETQGPGERGGRAGNRAFGTITSVGVDRFEVKRMDATAQTVMVDDQTRYREGQRDAQKDLQLEDLKAGDRVLVQGRRNDNKEFVASMVHRVTEQDIQRFEGERAFGEITSIDGNQLKVRSPRRGDITVVVNEQTVFMKEGQPTSLKDLKVGDRVFAVGKENNGQFVAARVVSRQFPQDAGQSKREPRDH